jgi:anti-sigma B factor antagonist
MDITYTELPNHAVKISLSGRLDTRGVDAVETRFIAASRHKDALVDLSGVDFVASMALRMFIGTARALKASGHRMVLFAPQHLVNEVFSNASIGEIIPVLPDEQQALATLG